MSQIEHTNTVDDHVDEEIFSFLDLDNPSSFFLFAGAGSGKTRSLVEVLKKLREKYEQRLKMQRQQIAVITYTNAARDEILRRLEFNSVFSVSTIHSFIWQLIESYTDDIRKWLNTNLASEIADLEEQQRKGRAGKASLDRAKKIESKTKRLANIENIRKFTYNPNGTNSTKDSLNHNEVIEIGASFLLTKQLMQLILIGKYPILLIDESQDTKAALIDAFFEVQKTHKARFSLGLIGDTMQRIYADGKANLGVALPEDWKKPVKKMNHRCPKRVITLLNKIREKTDAQIQLPRVEKADGTIRVYLANHTQNKTLVENYVKSSMATITSDPAWTTPNENIKSLILEHHMSASRLGFLPLFEPLYKSESLRTSLLDGSLSGMRIFTQLVLPIYTAHQNNNSFAIAKVVREYSPLLKKDSLKKIELQTDLLKKANESVTDLLRLWENDQDPTLLEIIKNIYTNGLFEIPDSLLPIITRDEKQPVEESTQSDEDEEENEDEEQEKTFAWEAALKAPFSMVVKYFDYISDKSAFATHQGVKGLQFPRVLVILDDEEARGFMFSYEKLVGGKPPSKTDIENVKDGKETVIDRTLRLFYVSCSRAEDSLAIIIYTDNNTSVSTNLINEGWFDKSEIITIPNQ